MGKQPAQEKPKNLTTEQIDAFDMLWRQLSSLYTDIESLAKKKQDGIMSQTRVSAINRVLVDVQELLKDEPSLKFLALLDDEKLPQNADALLFLGQYKSAMATFRAKNTFNASGFQKWNGTDRGTVR